MSSKCRVKEELNHIISEHITSYLNLISCSVGNLIDVFRNLTDLQDEEFAEFLAERILPLCPQEWTVEAEDAHMGPFSKGKWTIDSVDSRIQIYRYEPGGIFTQHRDGPIYKTPHLRSFFTALTYMSSGYKGGNTTLFSEDLTQSYKVEPSPGLVFIMLQKTLHEGSKVEEGIKYAMRCDILYRRTEGTLQDCISNLSVKEQAQKWFQLGAALELSGNIDGSIEFYKRAYKLDPDVEIDHVLPT